MRRAVTGAPKLRQPPAKIEAKLKELIFSSSHKHPRGGRGLVGCQGLMGLLEIEWLGLSIATELVYGFP